MTRRKRDKAVEAVEKCLTEEAVTDGKTNKLTFDVMVPRGGGNERFVRTMTYEWRALWKINLDKFREWIMERLPSLVGKPFNVYPKVSKGCAIKTLHFNQTMDEIERYGV